MASLPVLQLVHHARNAHGCRHSQYDGYAEFCARKVARGRKQLGLVQQRGKRFDKKSVAAAKEPDVRHLTALLFEAERAWAQAQHLKTQLATGKISTRAKQHALRRLARAGKHAQALTESCCGVADLDTASLSQAEAYSLILTGTHAFDASRWQAAHDRLAAAHAVLDAVADAANDADGQALAYEAQDDISPMLRVCRHQLKLSSPVPGQPETFFTDWPSIKEKLAADGASSQTKTEPVKLQWRDRTEDVRNAELARAVSKAQQSLATLEANLQTSQAVATKRKREKRLGGAGIAAFDTALAALTDAEEIARRSVDDNQIALDKAHSMRFAAATAPLRFAHAYLRTRLLATRCQRDLLLAHDSRKPVVAVKLYDAALQALEQLVEIDLLVDDGDAAEALEAQAVIVRGQRCMHLARAYSTLKQHPKAALLAERAVLYARQAKPAFKPSPEELDVSLRPLALTDATVEAFETEAKSTRASVGKVWFAAGPDADAADTLAGVSLDGPSTKKPHKPLFFDIAVNYATQPDLAEIARRAGKSETVLATEVMQVDEPVTPAAVKFETPAQSRKGIWGLFGR